MSSSGPVSIGTSSRETLDCLRRHVVLDVLWQEGLEWCGCLSVRRSGGYLAVQDVQPRCDSNTFARCCSNFVCIAQRKWRREAAARLPVAGFHCPESFSASFAASAPPHTLSRRGPACALQTREQEPHHMAKAFRNSCCQHRLQLFEQPFDLVRTLRRLLLSDVCADLSVRRRPDC